MTKTCRSIVTKVVSSIIVILILISIIPIFRLSVNAAETIKINDSISIYYYDSEWVVRPHRYENVMALVKQQTSSDVAEKIRKLIFGGNRAKLAVNYANTQYKYLHNSNYEDVHSLSRSNGAGQAKDYIYLYDTETKQYKSTLGLQCNAYAKYAYYNIFGELPTHTVKGYTDVSSNEALKRVIEQYAFPGAFINTPRPHAFMYIASSSDGKGFYVLEATSKWNANDYSNYYCRLAYYTWGEWRKRTGNTISCIMLPKNYKRVNDNAITISNKSGTVTNTTAPVTVTLNKQANVDRWSYFLSTDKSAVSAIDGTASGTHTSTNKVDCVRILDYTSKNKTEKSDSWTFTKYQGKALTPNTTYYYRSTVYINGKWYQSSVSSFKTANNKPASPVIKLSKHSDLFGIGDQVSFLWDSAREADYYTVSIKNAEGVTVQSMTNIKGLVSVIDGIESPGVYSATISAVNSAGTTIGSTISFTIKPNVNVIFYDTISNTIIDTVSVPYGHDATPVNNPDHYGHTFSKWDKSYENVTEDVTINTVYDKNSYNVRFIDSATNKILKTQTVKYEEAVDAPDVIAPEGYVFAGWDKNTNSITADEDVRTIYKWADVNHPTSVSIEEVSKNTLKQGYDIKAKIINGTDNIQSGRLVIALKSSRGLLLTSTESAAFAIDSYDQKTITQTILYEGLAPKVEVYAINGYESLGVISNSTSQLIDNSTSSEWSEWITYTGECPVQESDEIKVETQTVSSASPDIYVYRYKTRETTTSYNTSMTGYTKYDEKWEKSGGDTIDYATSWPSGYNKSNSLYSKYNKSKKSATESATAKTVIDSDKTLGYIYWHWCRGQNLNAEYNRCVSDCKDSPYTTFHAVYSTENKSFDSSANAYYYKNTSACGDSYWWIKNRVTIKRQTYTTYNKLFYYYKVSDYSDWIEYSGEVPVKTGEKAGTNQIYETVETDVIKGVVENVYQYRYKTTTNPPIEEPVIDSNRIVDISGNIGVNNAGTTATVWVYKYTQSSDFTTEYISDVEVHSDGSISIEAARLREAPSTFSGDYTVVASVNGHDRAIEIATIQAPKPIYSVSFLDFDGREISSQRIVEGECAIAPNVSELSVPEGRRFVTWSDSFMNIKANMTIYPVSVLESYSVAFVNWNVQSVFFKEYTYGSRLDNVESPESEDGYLTRWVIFNESKENYTTLDDYISNSGVVTKDIIVETVSELKDCNVTIIGANRNRLINFNGEDESSDNDEMVIDASQIEDDAEYTVTEYVAHNGDYIDFSNVSEEVEENDDYIFYGWINLKTGEYIDTTKISGDIVIYPSYEFSNNVEKPTSSLASGEYSEEQTVTISTETENSVIWYTIDGSDPKVSETAIEYSEPLLIDSSVVLRFYACALGCNDSEEESRFYAINSSGKPVYHLVYLYSLEMNDYYSVPSVGLVKHNSKLNNSLLDSFEGYTFSGLYYDNEKTEKFYFDSESITESIILYADYTANEYNVTFVDYDDRVISIEAVEYKSAAELPENPYREGYVFLGWNGDYSYITGDTVITAQYIPEEEYATIVITRNRPLSISRGSSVQLNAKIIGETNIEYDIVWDSKDSLIATITDQGYVTAVSPGTTEIIVSLPYTGASASLTVTVTDSADYSILPLSDSGLRFDTNRYLRGIPLTNNTVMNLSTMFENDSLVFKSKSGSQLNNNDLVGTGSIIEFYSGEELLDSITVIMTGDFNGDGRIQTRDVSMLSQHVLDLRDASDVQSIAVDVNGDGYVNVRDCAMISRYLAGKEEIE